VIQMFVNVPQLITNIEYRDQTETISWRQKLIYWFLGLDSVVL